MSDCLFCKIIKGEVPSSKVYEDEYCYAFKDINPAAPVHILFIPKEHIESVACITSENSAVVSHIFEKIAENAKGKEFENGFRIVSNIGDDAGQSVKHLHFHVLAGREFTWPAG